MGSAYSFEYTPGYWNGLFLTLGTLHNMFFPVSNHGCRGLLFDLHQLVSGFSYKISFVCVCRICADQKCNLLKNNIYVQKCVGNKIQ